MVMNFLAPQSPTTEVDLDFKTFFVSLVESACRDGLTLADIDQEIAGVREGLDVPGLESWPLKIMSVLRQKWKSVVSVARLRPTANSTALVFAPTPARLCLLRTGTSFWMNKVHASN